MKILVIGGTGTVGRQVVQELVQQQASVRVLITSPEKAKLLPEGVDVVVGDLEQPGTLPKAFTDIDTVFLLNQRSRTEGAQGQYAIAAAKRAGVRKVVYQSSYHARQGAHVPHFQPKITIENVLMQSGLQYVFICPNNFYQNDFLFTESIATYGVYPQPIGNLGLNRVDVRDIAEATTKALLTDDFNGQRIPLVGPQALTGSETARLLSEQLDTTIEYAGNDLVRWSIEARRTQSAWLVEDWAKTYQFFQYQGLKASEADLVLCTDVLGHAPRSYADFVAEYAYAFRPSLELA